MENPRGHNKRLYVLRPYAGIEEHNKKRFLVVRSTCLQLVFTILPMDSGWCRWVSDLRPCTFVRNALSSSQKKWAYRFPALYNYIVFVFSVKLPTTWPIVVRQEYSFQRRGPIVSHLPCASSSPSPIDLPLRAARVSFQSVQQP